MSRGKWGIVTIFNRSVAVNLQNEFCISAGRHSMPCLPPLGWVSDSDTAAVPAAGKQKTTDC